MFPSLFPGLSLTTCSIGGCASPPNAAVSRESYFISVFHWLLGLLLMISVCPFITLFLCPYNVYLPIYNNKWTLHHVPIRLLRSVIRSQLGTKQKKTPHVTANLVESCCCCFLSPSITASWSSSATMSRRESRLSLNIRQTDALSEFENCKQIHASNDHELTVSVA